MTDIRDKLQTILYTIENLPLEVLQKLPELERAVPGLYQALQIDDVCDHKFTNGTCICGAKINIDIGEKHVSTTIQHSS
jgi:hypothetical protein